MIQFERIFLQISPYVASKLWRHRQLYLAISISMYGLIASSRAEVQQDFAQNDQSTAATLDRFAKKVIDFLDQEGQSAIVVGKLVPVGKRPIPGGPGLAAQLIANLNRRKPNVVHDNAVWTIEGNLLFGDDPADRGRPEAERNMATTIKFTVMNQSTAVEWNETVVISKLSENQVFVGANSQLPPNADLMEIKREMRRSISSAPWIDPALSSMVRPISGSPYALQLRNKPVGAETSPGTPIRTALIGKTGLLPGTEQSYAFAKMEKRQEYEVLVYNDSTKEIAVAIFVDGIDVFAFSEDLDPTTKKSIYTHFIVAPKSKIEVPGWHQTADKNRSDNFLAFLITDYGRGARSRLFPQSAPDESVGAVTVAISDALKPGDVHARSSSETGFGRPIKQDQKPVARIIEPAHAYITIRYDR